jgi:carbonic anhydrase/acetyltransferase-like protein (isoleucine patch superfamily)
VETDCCNIKAVNGHEDAEHEKEAMVVEADAVVEPAERRNNQYIFIGKTENQDKKVRNPNKKQFFFGLST